MDQFTEGGIMARFDNQSAIITGAGGGIGFATANRMGSEGASITVVDFHEGRAKEAVTRLTDSGIDARMVFGDVSDPKTVESAVRVTLDTWDRIDILINNAGGGSTYDYGNIWELPVDAMDIAFRNNFMGTFLFTRAVVPHMLENDYGRIVNTASVAGKEGNPQRVPYSASKAAVIGLTKSVGKELALTGIRVNCITPAVVMTRPNLELNQQELDYMIGKIPMGRTGKVEEMAAMIAWLSSKECSFTTGAVFDISGGRATY
jgi:3-oxoacyl-[acyl-carrier protein] reductase